jgi:membrane dipeptidase
VIIGAQNCDFILHADVAEAVEVFAKMGLRVMTAAYNHRSFAADGCATGTDDGLTKDGKTMIRAMEKYGVVVDMSHVGRRSTLDIMDYCTKPAVFTHSNSDKLFPHYRNVTDEQVKKCAANGGVIGVSLFNVISWNGGDRFPTIEDTIDNIAYYADLVGIDHVGLGSDSGASPGTYPHRVCTNICHATRDSLGNDSLMYRSYEAGRGVLGYFIEGCESLANFPNISEHMLRRGFSKEDIQKVQGGNWMRIFKQWWK